MHGQALAVTQAAIAAEIHQALDVHRDFAAQIAFDLIFAVDHLAQPQHLVVGQLMDATLIRGTLVPAFMRLAGKANWWAPPALRRIQQRWGISDAEPPAPPALLPDEERVRV